MTTNLIKGLDADKKANHVAAAYREFADYWEGHLPGGDLDGQIERLETAVKTYGEVPIDVPSPGAAREVAEA